ncbi:hypothetical protein NUW58_g3660 [Xylaria curta]|uniref:Uncharacterized protein n=1 Tax=Xylaria curta TaxID=42375 RepID=A0ACC1P9X5_9PEZI|nr:hypothetical protein NUW58_g3660 [Xylaria curta]
MSGIPSETPPETPPLLANVFGSIGSWIYRSSVYKPGLPSVIPSPLSTAPTGGLFGGSVQSHWTPSGSPPDPYLMSGALGGPDAGSTPPSWGSPPDVHPARDRYSNMALFSHEEDEDFMQVLLAEEARQGREAEARIQLVRDHFNNLPRFTFEDIIGRGAFGIAFKVTERRFAKRPRRLVVKRAFFPETQFEIRNEIAMMLEVSKNQWNPANIAHGDLHGGNILLGTPGDFREHALIPPVKLIDFGSAREDEQLVSYNLTDVSKQMVVLITHRPQRFVGIEEDYNGIKTWAVGITPQGGHLPRPDLDPELRDLLAYCLAVNPNFRPPLAEVLRICKRKVKKTPDELYPGIVRETDPTIRELLQELVYDGDS